MINSIEANSTSPDEASGQDTDLRSLLENTNIADDLDEEKLKAISKQVSEGFEYDLLTRAEWEKNLEEWMKLALQVKEDKSWPWTGASNVKYPLLSTAAMQFNARAYPSLIPASGTIVKCDVIGADKDGEKLAKASRVSKYLSFQLLNEMDNWEEDMDKLLLMLPIVGTIFKKTYYNSVTKKNVSELVMPLDLVVDFWAKSLEGAERVSQIIRLNKRQVKERMMSGIFRDVTLADPQIPEDRVQKAEIKQDETLPYEFVEQHTYFDLDGDEYAEPYIITFERKSKEVVRIVPRFDISGLLMGDDGKLQQIVPLQYFTKYTFIPNPNCGFYDISFGLLLTPINESVNTLINQLTDAGTLRNLQGGILGKGLKLKMGETPMKPGEFRTVQTSADDIRKQVMLWPTNEPSKVLFELLGTLITSGKELASIAEIFVGKMPGQNTPATTTMATIEQGMKVFTAVYKRLYRSLKSEYKKLFTLNKMYLDPQKYVAVLDETVDPSDFDDESYDICPNADPATPTQTEKLMKAQALLELLPTGVLDPLEVVSRVLAAQEQPNVERLFNQQIQQTGQFTPPPDPKLQEMEMKGKLEQDKNQMKMAESQHKMEIDARTAEQQLAMKQQEHAMDMSNKREQAQLDGAIAVHKQKIFSVTEAQKANQQMVQSNMQHQQTMQQTKEKQSLMKSKGNGATTPSQKKSSTASQRGRKP